MLRSFVRAAAIGFVGTSLLAGALPATAQDVGKIVAYRQGIMKALGWHIGPIAGMAKGEVAFDQAKLQHHANALAALSQILQEGFPEGSAGDSKAKPDIWTNWADFETKVDGLETATAALAAGAGGVTDAGGIGALLGPVGGACKACHDSYRAQ